MYINTIESLKREAVELKKSLAAAKSENGSLKDFINEQAAHLRDQGISLEKERENVAMLRNAI